MQRHIVAITMGDPAGIGPEICLKSVQRLAKHSGRHAPALGVVLFGDAFVLRRMSQAAKLPLPPIAQNLQGAINLACDQGASVLHLESLGDNWTPGAVNRSTGRASFVYITKAIEAALDGDVHAVVTGPIHKEAMRQSGVLYVGHTEIFDALANGRALGAERIGRHGVKSGPVVSSSNAVLRSPSQRACMMLTSDVLTCSFVTTHIGLCDVSNRVTTPRILDVIELTAEAVRRLKHREPKLAVCGLNPHAGEHGLFGSGEEERLIAPAIEAAKQKGIEVQGPLPPDTAFLPARRKNTDAYICMYHDQGHIPLKALSFETAVNVTLGIPIVRTSVDHGTALDIAWKSYNADVSSMIHAIQLAIQLISPFIPVLSGARF